MTRQAGQAIVETALVLPLLLFIALGFTEAGILVATKADQDRSTAVVATWAADHPGADWQAVADQELPGCDVDVATSADPPDLVTAAATCEYLPRVTRGLWDGLPISSEETAASEPAATSAPVEPSASAAP